jgi:hypothetical protein
MRNFALRDERSPRQAALKAAKGAPAWMADKIWKPMVKKVGTVLATGPGMASAAADAS